jgi:hypothetical protein
MKSGDFVTEARAAKFLCISRQRLARAIRVGLLVSIWSRGRRLVMLP